MSIHIFFITLFPFNNLYRFIILLFLIYGIMINKKLLVLFIIAFACSLNFSFAYPKLSESDHKFIDTMLNRYHSISKDLKKEKSELYSKVANDAKVLRNAYL